MNVGDQKQPQWRYAARPARGNERGLGKTEAPVQQPAIGTPNMSEQRIDETRYEKIRIALAELDQSAVWINSAPFGAGDHARRRQAASPELRSWIFSRENRGVHLDRKDCSALQPRIH